MNLLEGGNGGWGREGGDVGERERVGRKGGDVGERERVGERGRVGRGGEGRRDDRYTYCNRYIH